MDTLFVNGTKLSSPFSVFCELHTGVGRSGGVFGPTNAQRLLTLLS